MRIGDGGKGGRAALGIMLAAVSAAAAMPTDAAPIAGTTAMAGPAWVQAHHPFTLALTGQSPLCAPEFTHPEAALVGGELVLSVLARPGAGFACADDLTSPYRTEFTVPGLDTGIVPVQVRWRAACEFDPAPCPAAPELQSAGTLQVTDSARLAYHIEPRAVQAGRPAKVLLQGAFGCSDKITNLIVDTARPSIYLDFTVQHFRIQCDTLVPGIEFPLPPLSAGVWQVYAAPFPYCDPGTVCTYLRIAPQLAGALEVTASGLPVLPRARGTRARTAAPGRPGFRTPGFRPEWRGIPRDAAGRRAQGPRPSAPADAEPALGGASGKNLPGGNP